MGRNLNYQFLSAINQCYREGMDKHAAKQRGELGSEKIYSRMDRKQLIDTSSQLADWIKANHPNIKMVRQISADQIQEWLCEKSFTCNRNTLKQYASRIRKLERIIAKAYKAKTDWEKNIVVPASLVGDEKRRDIPFERTDLEQILNRAYKMKSKSQSVTALELASRFALRVSEAVKVRPMDIDFQKMQFKIHKAKGGRKRTIPIRPEDVPYLTKLIAGMPRNKRIVRIKEDSVNKYLSRAEEALGIREKYQEAKSGVHAIRKMRAQELYDEAKANGLSRREAAKYISQFLGHGKNRKDVIQVYIMNP